MSAAFRRPNMRRAVVILPNGFTLGNLFFGVFAIVSATRGEYMWAGWCVVLGGVMDALDGRVARMTRTGSAFVVELDSLVDAVSFGVAPSTTSRRYSNASPKIVFGSVTRSPTCMAGGA